MNTRKQMSGASLLEALVSLSLLATGLLAFLQTDSKVLQHNRLAAEQSSAIHLAQQKLAQLQFTMNAASGDEDINDSRTHYQRRWQISTNSPLKRIESRVLWLASDGEQQTIHLERLVYNTPNPLPASPKVTLQK